MGRSQTEIKRNKFPTGGRAKFPPLANPLPKIDIPPPAFPGQRGTHPTSLAPTPAGSPTTPAAGNFAEHLNYYTGRKTSRELERDAVRITAQANERLRNSGKNPKPANTVVHVSKEKEDSFNRSSKSQLKPAGFSENVSIHIPSRFGAQATTVTARETIHDPAPSQFGGKQGAKAQAPHNVGLMHWEEGEHKSRVHPSSHERKSIERERAPRRAREESEEPRHRRR